MRGEDDARFKDSYAAEETPPHAWGRHGYTPDIKTTEEKHPHMRGEDMLICMMAPTVGETPPHAWGRHTASRESASSNRNTPTCVGKTGLRAGCQRMNWKHPHMRGEDERSAIIPEEAGETPPHAWGRQNDDDILNSVYGNTPTCVGKTYTWRVLPFSREKHPHMRGEDKGRQEMNESLRETPPHAWGRPHMDVKAMPRSRNTPTCVGKTFFQEVRLSVLRKHPHMRGEDRTQATAPDTPLETPPHAWGRPYKCPSSLM